MDEIDYNIGCSGDFVVSCGCALEAKPLFLPRKYSGYFEEPERTDRMLSGFLRNLVESPSLVAATMSKKKPLERRT